MNRITRHVVKTLFQKILLSDTKKALPELDTWDYLKCVSLLPKKKSNTSLKLRKIEHWLTFTKVHWICREGDIQEWINPLPRPRQCNENKLRTP